MCHVGDAIRSLMNLGYGDFQLVKHFPEQYLVIFSDPTIASEQPGGASSMTMVARSTLPPGMKPERPPMPTWSLARIHVRIEGTPLHAWGEDVAEKVLYARRRAIHYMEEHTRLRERTRTYEL
jgi:hypothetical protein